MLTAWWSLRSSAARRSSVEADQTWRGWEANGGAMFRDGAFGVAGFCGTDGLILVNLSGTGRWLVRSVVAVGS